MSECLRLGYAVAVATDEYCEASFVHQEDTNGVDIHLPYCERFTGFALFSITLVGFFLLSQ